MTGSKLHTEGPQTLSTCVTLCPENVHPWFNKNIKRFSLMIDVLFIVVDGCVLLDINVLYVTETATVHIPWIIFGHSVTCDAFPYLCGTKGVSTCAVFEVDIPLCDNVITTVYKL